MYIGNKEVLKERYRMELAFKYRFVLWSGYFLLSARNLCRHGARKNFNNISTNGKTFIYFGVIAGNTLSTNDTISSVKYTLLSPLVRDIATHLAELTDEIVQCCVINRTQCY